MPIAAVSGMYTYACGRAVSLCMGPPHEEVVHWQHYYYFEGSVLIAHSLR